MLDKCCALEFLIDCIRKFCSIEKNEFLILWTDIFSDKLNDLQLK